MPMTQSKVRKPVKKVDPPKQQRKPKVSNDKDPAATSKSKSKSEHLDTDFQSNAMTQPGSSTSKLPYEPKTDDGDVRIVLLCDFLY